jgi:hypothetical protein
MLHRVPYANGVVELWCEVIWPVVVLIIGIVSSAAALATVGNY